MSLLSRLFGPSIELPSSLTARLAAWRALPAVDGQGPLEHGRFVVVDLETTGLNPRRDRPLSLGALPVENLKLAPGSALAADLRNDTPTTRANILIHGIGPQRQAAGTEPVFALMHFLELARKDILIAYHAKFDRAVLDRALREHLGVRLDNPWIDLAWAAPALFPQARLGYAALDVWLQHFGLRAAERHTAAADAHVSGELFLILLAEARRQGIRTVDALCQRIAARAELAPGSGVGGP